MAIITLTTGWADDFYVAAMRGILLSAMPSAHVVDMSHRAPAFNTGISYAAYIVKHSYSFFPKGTVHIISITSEYSDNTPFAAAYYNGHYFVGTDNGIFGLLFDNEPEAMVCIENYKDDVSPNYPALSVFAPAAIHLANGGNIAELGRNYVAYKRKSMLQATVEESQITGVIVYTNAFGNAITNITREDFERIGKGRQFEILLNSVRNKITRINKYFHETSPGEILALFNISGHLELAQNKGQITQMLKLSPNMNIIVKFFDKKL